MEFVQSARKGFGKWVQVDRDGSRCGPGNLHTGSSSYDLTPYETQVREHNQALFAELQTQVSIPTGKHIARLAI